jgi:ectoine hydroxylase-related dioxygenase (phytanoyl-CoA dioxygenase family)
MEITPSIKERAAEALSSARLNQAVAAIRNDGYVVLEAIVSHDHLDQLRERMDRDSQELIAAKQWGGAGGLPGHLQQGPPPFAPFVFRDIVSNPFVIQVSEALFGDRFFNGLYSGNSNCSGSGTQPLHRDCDHLWPGLTVAHPAASVVVNIAPQDVSDENGSIELWPGSHLDTSVGSGIDSETESARRAVVPPIRGNSRKGSVMIRDMRLWHRGVPNQSDRPRHMIAMIHNIGWFARRPPLTFGRGCESAFTDSALDHHVVFTDEPIDYLFRGSR